ncbi:hypothetical protein Ahu01nite_080910 [Winogradskya humida]|uniref:VOC domain-containing protein n=2 Tax=Winogradskya humida TaxID=113566 RepID=A0ABQ4A2A3_9ACTN|nr:hypothetical protein Ahu01nite_080910 [Actinoplanes humidus]
MIRAGTLAAMFLGIDHVGLMTDDPARAGTFMKLLGMSLTDQGAADAYGVSCDFWQFSDDARETAVELVAPTRDDSAIAVPLSTRGPGLYHVAFEVDDLDADAEELVAAGFVRIDEDPHPGARPGMRVQFLYLPEPVNSLMELVQYDQPRRRKG